MLLPNVLAIDLTVEKISSEDVMIVDVNQPASITLKVTNNGASDKFLFYTFFGAGLESGDYIQISKGQTKEVHLKFLPRSDEKLRGFVNLEYFIQQFSDKTEYREKMLINLIDLKDAFSVGVQNLNPESTSADITFFNKVNSNFENLEIKLDSVFFKLEEKFSIANKDARYFTVDLNKEDFNKLTAGFYTLKTEIKYKDAIANIESKIKFVEKDLLKTEKSEYGFIVNTKIIEKTNEGNVEVSSTTTIKKGILSRLFTSFSPEPTIVEREKGKIYYTWNYEISPGKSYKIVVKTNWIIPFLILIFLIIIVVALKFFGKKDLVLKKRVDFVNAKGGEFALRISVMVHAKKYLENVNIIDKLPPLVKLYEKFGPEKPSKFSQEKKRVEWNFEKLEEGERRVLKYIIYSKVGVVGKFALPRTRGIFEREGKIKEISSNQTYFVAEQISKRE